MDIKSCKLCPNACAVDRNCSVGACGAGSKVKIANHGKFFYEEPCISGTRGSGAVFFCGCSLKCVFCQNYEVSRNTVGREITVNELADIFKELESEGCHNINLVNPTHYVDKIIAALEIYKPNIPIVYNTHGYESVEILKKIDKFVDIYLPDLKYFSPLVSARYTGKNDYFLRASEAVKYMAEKPTVIENGIMLSGCIVRHLILPLNTGDSLKIVEWYAENIGDRAYLSLMSQYTPFGAIDNFPELKRKITFREYDRVTDLAMELGLKNVFVQDLKSSGTAYIPKWES